jgi:hypothetical protein
VHQLLKTSFNQIRCTLTGHDVSSEDERKLFSDPQGTLKTTCSRCHYPLLLRKDPTDKEEGTYMLMER